MECAYHATDVPPLRRRAGEVGAAPVSATAGRVGDREPPGPRLRRPRGAARLVRPGALYQRLSLVPRLDPGRVSSPHLMLTGFPPIVDERARVLVLGSMPSAVSLQKGQYYAHPRNLFWRITGELLGFDASAPYEDRIAALRHAGVGLWDVLFQCERVGSLDASITRDSVAPNDLCGLLRSYPGIRRVFFNGATAERLFHRLVLLDGGGIEFRRLPSTSPANAAIRYDAKLRAWRAIVFPENGRALS